MAARDSGDAGDDGEFGRIARLFRPLAAGLPGARGLLDDAGVLAVPTGRDLLVTTDAMVEGVHYLPGEPADRLARKLLRVNLSDLAAMGAVPLAYTLTTALPKDLDPRWLDRFASGLAADQALWGCALLGGDSVSTPGPPLVSLTLFGHAAPGGAVPRDGARPNDRVWVSGTVGDAALGLIAARDGIAGLSPADADALTDRYHLPTPRLALGAGLVGRASAMLDLSDGLFGDLGHLCRASGGRASGVGAEIAQTALPFSPAARAALALQPALAETALAGGDDYELLFTAGPEHDAALADLAARTGTPLTAIGRITDGGGIRLHDAAGRSRPPPAGWTHF